MKQIDCNTLYLPYLCKVMNLCPTALAQCIVCVDDDGPIAGVVYDGYNQMTIGAHIWVGPDKTPSREWYVAIFDYPFRRLGVHKIIGQVPSSNRAAVKLDEHFGFVLEARIRSFSMEGDLLIYTMTQAQCRILKSPLWSKVSERVARVA